MRLVLLSILCSMHASALAAPTDTLRHQSRVLDAQGVPINSTLTVHAALHAHQTNDDEQWAETHTGVVIVDGYFSVALGSQQSFPSGLFESGSLWLELTVDSSVITPRTALNAVPYAMTAQRLGGSADALSMLCSRMSSASARTFTTLSTQLDSDPTGHGVCGPSSHVCSAAEFETYAILGNCTDTFNNHWLVGGFSNTDYHRRSIWNGQDSVQCQPGNYPRSYAVWEGYRGRIHCDTGSESKPILCCADGS